MTKNLFIAASEISKGDLLIEVAKDNDALKYVRLVDRHSDTMAPTLYKALSDSIEGGIIQVVQCEVRV